MVTSRVHLLCWNEVSKSWRCIGTSLLLALVLQAAFSYAQSLSLANPTASSAMPSAVIPSLKNPDAACAKCHGAIYAAYEQTSKARGSGLAVNGLIAGHFEHRPSGVTYSVAMKNGTAELSYHRDPSHARAALAGEVPLSYFIGSGKHGRTYLFSQPLETGQLWSEVPINWYARRAGYDMAPSFETSTSMPFVLPVDPGCLHCHTSGVQRNLSSARNAFAGAPFEQAGVGCAACHGDASAHIASGGKSTMVNGSSLDPVRRDSLCLQLFIEPGRRSPTSAQGMTSPRRLCILSIALPTAPCGGQPVSTKPCCAAPVAAQ